VIRVRWTPNAADDFTAIIERIRDDNPAAAHRVATRIYTAVAELRQFPNRGRKGLAAQTRELVFPPRPYIVVYEVIDTHADEVGVAILRIRHASQDWP
jgi:addiction module RelE/StbE family toxin